MNKKLFIYLYFASPDFVKSGFNKINGKFKETILLGRNQIILF